MFSPLSACIDQIGVFCSIVVKSQIVQYFKIIGINYLGTVFKMCANLTGFAISVDRFSMNNSESKNSILTRFSMQRVRHIVIGFSVFSALTCLAKCFEYQVNKYYYVAGFPNEITLVYSHAFEYILQSFSNEISYFDKISYHSYRATINDRTAWKMLLLQASLLFVHFINDFLILFVNLAIDACLCFSIRSNMMKTRVCTI